MSAPSLFRPVDGRRIALARDAAAVARVLAADPVGGCMVAARVADHGVDPAAIGGELWTRRGVEDSLCYAGANLIPLRGSPADVKLFAEEALSRTRRCSSVVGYADLVLPMWDRLQQGWGPARDVRDHQPLMALHSRPCVAADPGVRRVRVDELDSYLVAAIDMFIGEVGIDPRAGDGGRGYRRRVAGLIAAGRAFARFERGRVVFRNGNQMEYIELGAAPPPATTSPVKPTVPANPEAPQANSREIEGAEEAIQCDAEFSSCTVDKAFVEKLLANPAQLTKQARIVPAVRDGQTKGYKFYGIRPGSLPKLLGMKNGDLLTSVNGHNIESLDQAMDLYNKLRRASHLSVVLERKGEQVQKEIDIK